MKTLIGTLANEFDDKRFYFKGKIKSKCPNCNKTMILDFEIDEYLSYPKSGMKGVFSHYCSSCNRTYVFPFKLKKVDIVIEYDDDNMKEDL